MNIVEAKENNDSFAFMCGKCFQIYANADDVETHNCVVNKETSESYITAEVVKLEPPYASEDQGNTVIVNEKGKLEYECIDDISRSLDHIEEENEYEILDEDSGKRKRKNNSNDYVMNKLVRDPYFKLDHNSYTFKDTLGDWDERSTKLLISLVAKYPKVHFLLQFYFERRLSHWENIHSCMLNAGYNFTVLQLRMRWREVFAKYRWTLNHNDINEEKKTFEYMNEMDELFGVWQREATQAMINLVEFNYKDSPSTKHKRLGYMGWERIASLLSREGFKFSVLQVEARWRMLVTSYKSMVDHNIMPTVQPISAAFQDQLKFLVNYEPRRRKDYERYKGKKVKLEKFPESGMKHLIEAYKANTEKFMDSHIKNAEVWESIRKYLEALNYHYTVVKIKEIFFATLKLYERVLQHNSIPGAIKREGPHYKELSEIFDMYGFWPHVKRKRKTSVEKYHRKCALRLRESMQTWTTQESRALLKIYPEVLESLMGQTTPTHHTDLWVQAAHSFLLLGFPKRDTPEIATHIGLLRQGYTQGCNFPFHEEMKHVMEVEEALCYSPDVSKYTGEVEIVYWSHDAVRLMLNLYQKIQPLLPYSSLSKEVYARISKEMTHYGYVYSCDQVKEEFRTLLFQFTMRRYKPEKAPTTSWAKSKGIMNYKEEMNNVMVLREKLSVGFTNGIKPIQDDVLSVLLQVAREKSEELFGLAKGLSWEAQKERMKLVVFIIRRQIKKQLKRKPPVARKICVQLLTSLFNITETTERVCEDVAGLYLALQNYDYERILTEIMKETHNGSFKLPRHLLDMERSQDCIHGRDDYSGGRDEAELCVLSVTAVKQEQLNMDDGMVEEGIVFGSPEDDDEDDYGFADEGDSVLRVDSGMRAGPSRLPQKMVVINERLGTKTTVRRDRRGQKLTQIDIADIRVKEEPMDAEEEADGTMVRVAAQDEGGDAEFDVIHSLDPCILEELIQQEDCEVKTFELDEEHSVMTLPLEGSLLSELRQDARRTREAENEVLEKLRRRQEERSGELRDVIDQMADFLEDDQ